MRRVIAFSAALLAVSAGVRAAAVGVGEGHGPIAEFSEKTFPTNPQNGLPAFTFGDFAPPGALTVGPTSLILDVTDTDGSGDVFGGMGAEYGTPPSDNQVDFNASNAHWEMRVKILPANEAATLHTALVDHDGGDPVAAEVYLYAFDLSGVPEDGQFHLLHQPVTAPFFHQDAFGFDANDDNVINPGLRLIRVEGVFGEAGRLNVEIDYVRIVPEPASIVALALAAPFLAAGRLRLT